MQLKLKIKNLFIGVVIVSIGIIIGIIPIFSKKSKEIINNKEINDYIEKTSNDEENDMTHQEENQDINDKQEEKILFVLEIPKINLKRGIYHLNSSKNTIERNVSIMKESSLPTDLGGNVVLEAHSGNDAISFFDKLYMLNKDDIAYIYYQGLKYIYSVSEVYDVEKDGEVEVYRDVLKNTLTLSTCRENDQTKQYVVILYLLDKEEY